MKRFVLSLAVLVAGALLGACGGGASGPSAAPATTASSSSSAPATSSAPASAPALPAGPVHVARSATDLAVFATPDATAPTQVLPATTSFGSGRALLVLEETADWLRVALPVRPNGTEGWVRRADVTVRTVDEAIDVDLGARTLTLSRAGAVVLSTPVAVGSDSSPTPTGRFFLVDKLDTASAASAYGPFAFGLSGHSDVLTEFAGGDGQIGIHGTNDPSSIGNAVSHGCIRVPNDVIVQLNDLVALGTPVTIH